MTSVPLQGQTAPLMSLIVGSKIIWTFCSKIKEDFQRCWCNKDSVYMEASANLLVLKEFVSAEGICLTSC